MKYKLLLIALLPLLLFTGCFSAPPVAVETTLTQNGTQLTTSITTEPKEVTTSTSTPTTTLTPTPTPTPEDIMHVYFLDVGQADATLIKGPDFTILIDAGDYRRNEVVPHLNSLGVEEIDLLIGTHPHADHIGQFPQVLETFAVKEVWLSGDEATTATFERAIDAILASGAAYHEPRAGEVFNFGSSTIEVLHPKNITGDFHAGSISIKATYGKVSFIFTGDAEVPQEQEMITRGHNLSAQVLHLGHHGSTTSTSQAFLDAVKPDIAVYSAGEGNSYGHPHDEVIDRVVSAGIDLYGTDVHGTIIIETDGTSYKIDVEEEGEIRAPPVTTATAVTPTTTAVTPTTTAVTSTTTAVTPTTTAVTSTTTAVTPTTKTEPSGGCKPGQININTASFTELQKIIHIGPVRAQEIIDLRPFSSLDDLLRVSGIGQARLSDIKKQGLACVG